MKRIKGYPIALLALLSLLASSCVYSLFPIYTEDKVVFIPGIEGTWADIDSEDGSDSIRFESLLLQKVRPSFDVADPRYAAGYSLDELREVLKVDQLADILKKKEGFELFPPSYDEVDAARYKMTIYGDSDDLEVYEVYISHLGDHLFVDAYPYDSEGAPSSENYFPVHTFYKIELSDDRLIITMFDLEKLFDLFDSNLIRLRHEIVDEQVLITARPRELQKFLARYSKDESVFDSDRLVQKRVGP